MKKTKPGDLFRAKQRLVSCYQIIDEGRYSGDELEIEQDEILMYLDRKKETVFQNYTKCNSYHFKFLGRNQIIWFEKPRGQAFYALLEKIEL